MRRKQSVTHLDQRYNIMLDNAFYIVSFIDLVTS